MPLTSGPRVGAKQIDLTVHAYLGIPVAADDDRIVVSVDIADAALTIAANVDSPRNLTYTITDLDSSVTAGQVIATGLAYDGSTIQEATDLAGGSRVVTGTKIFYSVSSVDITGAVGGVTVDDVIKVGVGNVIGLPIKAGAGMTSDDVQCFLGGTRVAAPTVATGEYTTGVDASSGTYNGSKALLAVYNVGL